MVMNHQAASSTEWPTVSRPWLRKWRPCSAELVGDALALLEIEHHAEYWSNRRGRRRTRPVIGSRSRASVDHVLPYTECDGRCGPPEEASPRRCRLRAGLPVRRRRQSWAEATRRLRSARGVLQYLAEFVGRIPGVRLQPQLALLSLGVRDARRGRWCGWWRRRGGRRHRGWWWRRGIDAGQLGRKSGSRVVPDRAAFRIGIGIAFEAAVGGALDDGQRTAVPLAGLIRPAFEAVDVTAGARAPIRGSPRRDRSVRHR